MPTPLRQYENLVSTGEIDRDEAQRLAVTELDRLWHGLNRSKPSWLSRLITKPEAPQGVYMWGGVGRGKTFLMDLFFDSLESDRKLRLHFHRFMQSIHEQLKAYAGSKDPLKKIATQMRLRTDVICFDEFFVSDITDAMILGELFKELFEQEIVLVATSNIIPEHLYANGLQRSRFLPAIKLIESQCKVINVDGECDYRLRSLEQAEIYHSPLDKEANDNLEFTFEHLSTGLLRQEHILIIHGRNINTVKRADGVVWFDFKEICQSDRSAADYIEISRLYHSVLISDMRQLDNEKNDAARRFISLVDEFYERHVKLIISAAVPLSDLYTGSALSFEFERTESRLIEMQSRDYLALEHLP